MAISATEDPRANSILYQDYKARSHAHVDAMDDRVAYDLCLDAIRAVLAQSRDARDDWGDHYIVWLSNYLDKRFAAGIGVHTDILCDRDGEICSGQMGDSACFSCEQSGLPDPQLARDGRAFSDDAFLALLDMLADNGPDDAAEPEVAQEPAPAAQDTEALTLEVPAVEVTTAPVDMSYDEEDAKIARRKLMDRRGWVDPSKTREHAENKMELMSGEYFDYIKPLPAIPADLRPWIQWCDAQPSDAVTFYVLLDYDKLHFARKALYTRAYVYTRPALLALEQTGSLDEGTETGCDPERTRVGKGKVSIPLSLSTSRKKPETETGTLLVYDVYGRKVDSASVWISELDSFIVTETNVAVRRLGVFEGLEELEELRADEGGADAVPEAEDKPVTEDGDAPVAGMGTSAASVDSSMLSQFGGLSVQMIFDEAVPYSRPHVRASSGKHTASVSVDGKLLAGSLPKKKKLLLRAWLLLHEDELYAAWNRVVGGKPAGEIAPLR